MGEDRTVTAVHIERPIALGRLELFASGPNDPRARRPIDWIRAMVSLAFLVVFAVLSDIGADLDEASSSVLLEFPPSLRVVWLMFFWLALAWALTLLCFAFFGKRPGLALEVLAASGLSLATCFVVALIVTDDASRVFTEMFSTDGPPTFPPAAVAVTAAVTATMAPYITLPLRRLGRLLLVGQLVAAVFLGVSLGSGAVTALAVGTLAGSVCHLVAGSPGGFPTPGRVAAGLAQLGVIVDDVSPVRLRRDGVALLEGHDRAGKLDIKVYGRDAWDGELLAGAWSHLWYRDTRHATRLGRSELVEHEGFMTFLASRAGVRVSEVVTAGRAPKGDALIVVRPAGTPLELIEPSLSPRELDSLWDQLALLHAQGIAHRRIDVDRIVRHEDDGTAGFGDLSSLSVQARDLDLAKDRAQLFALATLAKGEEAAVASARRALGDPDLVDVIPYLQEAALPPIVRSSLNRRGIDFDDVRKRLADTLGAERVELVKLRRVTWGSVFNMALLTIAAYAIIGMLGGIDFVEFGKALQNANWWWLFFALFIGQLPRVAAAFSTMGSSRDPLPLGPTVALQFATCYINLTVPSSAGRVALTTRYFQRNGVPVATALSAGFIDTLSQTLIQITIFVVIFFASDIELDLSVGTDDLSGLATIALVAVGAIVLAVIVVACVPSLRRRVLAPLHQMQDALVVLRMPSHVLQLFGGNLGSEILFAITLAMVTRGFGYELPLSTFLLINSTVSLFGSLIPVPGGIGVMEAGLTAGLTRAGVDNDTAFAIALTHRFITFYLPPIWGFMSYQWLIKHRFL
ncbi:MAG TPA: lysylphosphatidylglycerol synthase transmembrane domain-containing protein [Ilumatobacter sp.]|jgi:uncharacterized membrane protein YbhN (UPF0104 family)|nr:lysylphosphatidylglycerol synthase transmembrane domain-containing protein [Ilumatobacter sp.]